MDKASLSKFRSDLKKWVKAERKTEAEAIKLLAQSVGFELMRKSYPLGTTAASGKKFMGNIGNQIFKGAMRRTGSTLKEAHLSARDGRGRVPGKLYFKKGGHYNIKTTDETYFNAKKANAGMLKMGWLIAAEKVKGAFGKRKLPNWLSRHLGKSSLGTASVDLKGLRTTIYLTNNVTYVSEKNTKVANAIRDGYKNVLFKIKNDIEGTGRLSGRGNKII